jgi:DNA modification methylase
MEKKVTRALVRQSVLDERLRDIADAWFPESQVDGSVQREAIYDLLPSRSDSDSSDFGLIWPEKLDSVDLLRKPAQGALHPEKTKSLNWDTARHVLCVGENLEVLKLLQPAYFGRVKAAFIDPPYNTKDERIYEDDANDPVGAYLDFVRTGEIRASPDQESRQGRRHSIWMTMMLPRLFAVRNLLRDDGVVFVVIDDHESHRLRLLLDEVFGEENFVCTFIWQKRYSPAADVKDVGYVHENILCYRKTDAFAASLLPMTDAQRERYKNPDKDPNGPWKPADYTCRFTAKERPNLYYPIVNPNTSKKVWPKKTRVWACSPEEHEKNVNRKAIWWPKSASMPARKAYLKDIKQGAMPKTLLLHDDVGHTDEATKELREWLPELKVTPKPTRLVSHLLSIANLQEGDIVLDVFARVGTTAEVVARMNKQGRGLRVVLVQPHKRLDSGKPSELSEACRLRATAAIRKLEGKSAGLRVFSLGRSAFVNWALDSNAPEGKVVKNLESQRQRVNEDANDEQVLAEVCLQAGIELTSMPRTSKVGGATLHFYENESVIVTTDRQLADTAKEALLQSDAAIVVCREAALGRGDEARLEMARRATAAGKSLQTI